MFIYNLSGEDETLFNTKKEEDGLFYRVNGPIIIIYLFIFFLIESGCDRMGRKSPQKLVRKFSVFLFWAKKD